MTDLGIRGSTQSQASAINDADQVVGHTVHATSATHASLWQSGTVTDLGTLGGTESIAVAVNRLGQIAGGSYIAGDSMYHAVLWETYLR
jgi:probable HAF family extracellular repeat protein